MRLVLDQFDFELATGRQLRELEDAPVQRVVARTLPSVASISSARPAVQQAHSALNHRPAPPRNPPWPAMARAPRSAARAREAAAARAVFQVRAIRSERHSRAARAPRRRSRACPRAGRAQADHRAMPSSCRWSRSPVSSKSGARRGRCIAHASRVTRRVPIPACSASTGRRARRDRRQRARHNACRCLPAAVRTTTTPPVPDRCWRFSARRSRAGACPVGRNHGCHRYSRRSSGYATAGRDALPLPARERRARFRTRFRHRSVPASLLHALREARPASASAPRARTRR